MLYGCAMNLDAVMIAQATHSVLAFTNQMSDDFFRIRNLKVCGSTDKTKQNEVEC